MLRIAVSLVCVAGVAGMATAQTLPTIVVNGWYAQEAIYLGGDVGSVSSVWGWDGSGGSDVNPPYGNAIGAPDVCGVMGAYGRPADCDRSKVGQGVTAAPGVTQPEGWDALGLSNRSNEFALYACYSDPANDPETCEASFKFAMAQECMRFYNAIYNDLGSPYEQCSRGLNPVYSEITYAREFRKRSADFQINLSPEIGWFEVNINASWLSMMNWSPFNRMLLAARRNDACTRWYNVWDRLNCSSYYSIG